MGINHNLSQISGNSGILYFELNQMVNAQWQGHFRDYLCTIRPAAFSSRAPVIEHNRLIRAHVESEGAWGLEQVICTLNNMVDYANSKCGSASSTGPQQNLMLRHCDFGRLTDQVRSLKFQ